MNTIRMLVEAIQLQLEGAEVSFHFHNSKPIIVGVTIEVPLRFDLSPVGFSLTIDELEKLDLPTFMEQVKEKLEKPKVWY